ncbi:hypothetical protein GIB67_035308, partial [Kingdonia uniflora]
MSSRRLHAVDFPTNTDDDMDTQKFDFFDCVKAINVNKFHMRVYFNTSVGLSDLSVGDEHVCGVENVTGMAKCWYRGEDESKRGSFVTPKGVKFASITSGRGFSCGVLVDNMSVRCWGSTSIGLEISEQFGNVSMLSLVAGDSHVCGLTVTEQLDVLKGFNGFEFDGLTMGVNHSCAIRSVNGTVVCSECECNSTDITFNIILSVLNNNSTITYIV